MAGWTVVDDAPAAKTGKWTVVDDKPSEEKSALGQAWDALTSGAKAIGGAQADFGRRLVKGALGQDASGAGSFGMGMADPAVGGAQLMANLPGSPTAIASRVSKALGGPDANDLVRRREFAYERARTPGADDPEARMATPDLATDWARLAGNVASPMNVVGGAAGAAEGAISRSAPFLQRMIQAAPAAMRAGAMGGAMQPAGERGSFIGQKLPQIGAGAAAGAALGAPLAAAVRPPAVPMGPPPPPVGNPAVDRMIAQRFGQAVGFPSRGINRPGDLGKIEGNASDVFKDIIENKQSLVFDRAGRTVRGELPTTAREGADAVAQGMSRLWPRVERMINQADESQMVTSSPINKFNEAFAAAARREAELQRDVIQANRSMTQAMAKQSMAGNVYSSSAANREVREAQAAINQATRKWESAQRAKTNALRDINRPWVDLKPVANELRDLARRVETDDPGLSRMAARQARLFDQEEARSAADTQAAISRLNEKLDSSYASGATQDTNRAAIDRLIAGQLRRGLNKMVDEMVGEGSQEIRNLYGSYAALEKAFTKNALNRMNANDRGIFERFSNIESAHDLLRAIGGSGMAALRSATRAFRTHRNLMDNQDQNIQRLFSDVERGLAAPQYGPRPGMEFSYRGPAAMGFGGAAADRAERYKPIGSGQVRRYSLPDDDRQARPGAP